MGARNVTAAFAMWPHLDHAPFRLLVGMAVVALDQTSPEGRPARVYFGGEQAMTELLGRSRRMTYKALAALRDAGAVELLDAGRNGHRAVYRLQLDPLASVHPKGTQKGAPQVHEQGAPQVPESVHLVGTPRNHGGATEESREGDTSPEVPVSPAPAVASAETEIDAMDNGQRNQALIARHGTRVHLVLAEHVAQHPDCDDPVRHLLATTPARTLTVIPGGKTA